MKSLGVWAGLVACTVLAIQLLGASVMGSSEGATGTAQDGYGTSSNNGTGGKSGNIDGEDDSGKLRAAADYDPNAGAYGKVSGAAAGSYEGRTHTARRKRWMKPTRTKTPLASPTAAQSVTVTVTTGPAPAFRLSPVPTPEISASPAP